MHRVVKAIEARMNENGHGDFVSGHGAGDDNSEDL
jgi:hypothetical protein